MGNIKNVQYSNFPPLFFPECKFLIPVTRLQLPMLRLTIHAQLLPYSRGSEPQLSKTIAPSLAINGGNQGHGDIDHLKFTSHHSKFAAKLTNRDKLVFADSSNSDGCSSSRNIPVKYNCAPFERSYYGV